MLQVEVQMAVLQACGFYEGSPALALVVIKHAAGQDMVYWWHALDESRWNLTLDTLRLFYRRQLYPVLSTLRRKQSTTVGSSSGVHAQMQQQAHTNSSITAQQQQQQQQHGQQQQRHVTLAHNPRFLR